MLHGKFRLAFASLVYPDAVTREGLHRREES